MSFMSNTEDQCGEIRGGFLPALRCSGQHVQSVAQLGIGDPAEADDQPLRA